MRISKNILITLCFLFLASNILQAEEIKPLAPAFDLTMQGIETAKPQQQEATPCKSDNKKVKEKKQVKKDADKPVKEKKADKKLAQKPKDDRKDKHNKKDKNLAKKNKKDKKNKKQQAEDIASMKTGQDISVNADKALPDNNAQNVPANQQSGDIKEFLDFDNNAQTSTQPKTPLQTNDNMLTSAQKTDSAALAQDEQLQNVEENARSEINKSINAGEEEYVESMPKIDPMARKKLHSHNTGIRREAELLEFEMRLEDPKVLKDLRVLWSAAVEKSTTIRLAIQKLSNPDQAEKMEAGMMSKLLSPLASLAPMAMMASSSATQTASALIGGNMLGTLASDVDNQYNKAFIKVSDYDLIMLAKEVDELQAKLVVLYYEYSQASERLTAAENALQNAENLYHQAQKTSDFASNTAADAFYREAQQNYLNAKHNYLSARTSLEQVTGNDAIVYIESNINIDEEEKNNPEKAQEIVQPRNDVTLNQPPKIETVQQNPDSKPEEAPQSP